MTASGLLKDTVVLVSGGTQGLGAGIARQAAAEGAAGIAVTGRSAEAGGKIAEDLIGLGVPAVFLQADLGDTQQASSTVIRAIEHFGRLDAVVNAAGLTTRGSMTDTTPELFDEHIAVNLKAPVLHHVRGHQALQGSCCSGEHRQHHHHVLTRRPALPGAIRRVQGGARRFEPLCWPRPQLGQYQNQMRHHGMDVNVVR